jgi:hypothetical protein
MRTVNINNRERPAISLEVAGQHFEIKRVVTGVRQRWGEFLQLQGEALEKVADLQKKVEVAGGDMDKVRDDVVGAQEYSNRIAERRTAAEKECIELILEKNGYTFDWLWWLDETDSVDRQGFIIEALNKDTNTGGSEGKKKAGK